MFLIHIGNTVLNVIKSSLDQIQKFQYVLSRIPHRFRLSPHIFDPRLVFPHFLKHPFYIGLVKIKIIGSL